MILPQPSKTTAIVKAFERPQCLDRLLRSIRERFPSLPVVVADDSRQPTTHPLADKTIQLPYDSGESAGRNAALAVVDTEYILFLDDDFVFTDKTDVAVFENALDSERRISIIGGFVKDGASRDGWLMFDECWIRKKILVLRCDNEISYDPIGPYKRVDFVRNFWCGRTDHVRKSGGWDESIKIGSHLPFFLQSRKAGLIVCWTKECAILHDHKNQYNSSPTYKEMRDRAEAMRNKVLKDQHDIEGLRYRLK